VTRRAARAASALLVVLLLSGCAASLEVTPPAPSSPAVARICDALQAALPATVAGQSRRDTSPSSALTAAWGDPPIVLRCGVPRPAALTATSQVTEINGVDWFAEPLADGYLFTTSGRTAYVEVTVPSAYASQAGGLTQIGPAVLATDPKTPAG
jgi:hypothetical protein